MPQRSKSKRKKSKGRKKRVRFSNKVQVHATSSANPSLTHQSASSRSIQDKTEINLKNAESNSSVFNTRKEHRTDAWDKLVMYYLALQKGLYSNDWKKALTRPKSIRTNSAGSFRKYNSDARLRRRVCKHLARVLTPKPDKYKAKSKRINTHRVAKYIAAGYQDGRKQSAKIVGHTLKYGVRKGILKKEGNTFQLNEQYRSCQSLLSNSSKLSLKDRDKYSSNDTISLGENNKSSSKESFSLDFHSKFEDYDDKGLSREPYTIEDKQRNKKLNTVTEDSNRRDKPDGFKPSKPQGERRNSTKSTHILHRKRSCSFGSSDSDYSKRVCVSLLTMDSNRSNYSKKNRNNVSKHKSRKSVDSSEKAKKVIHHTDSLVKYKKKRKSSKSESRHKKKCKSHNCKKNNKKESQCCVLCENISKYSDPNIKKKK